MRKTLLATAILATTPFIGAGAAFAEGPISGTVTFASEYVSRGVSLSDGRPAIQGSLDYAHDSGFYAGIWGSSVSSDLNSSGVEIDVYLGYGMAIGDIGLDFSVTRFIFPGDASSSDTDSTELKIGVSYDFVTLAYYRDIDFDVNYLKLSASYEIMEGLSLDAHVGYQDPDDGQTKTDYSIGVTKAYAGLDFGLHYIDSNRSGDYPNVDNTLLLSVSKSF